MQEYSDGLEAQLMCHAWCLQTYPIGFYAPAVLPCLVGMCFLVLPIQNPVLTHTNMRLMQNGNAPQDQAVCSSESGPGKLGDHMAAK